MAPEVTFCSTPGSIELAVSTLSSQSVILVDCEAQDLGKPGCVLSIISLSDALAEHIFLIDALAFPSSPPCCAPSSTPASTPRPHPALAPLLALLSLPHITKVFFDGRADVLELLLAYGLVLANVLDLQLVEVAIRAHKCKPGQPARDLLKGYLSRMRVEVEHDPCAYAGIHALRGLEHIVGFYRLLPEGSNIQVLKDHAVAAMHKASGSAMWLARPLPAPLMMHAARDLRLMALVYANFNRKWMHESMRTLRAQSAVYVGMLNSREENERLCELKLNRFMPLGIVDRDGDDDDDSGPRYVCSCCRRELMMNCYTTRLQSAESEDGEREDVGYASQTENRERLSYCRLCNAVAQRNGRTPGEWVAF